LNTSGDSKKIKKGDLDVGMERDIHHNNNTQCGGTTLKSILNFHMWKVAT